MIALAAGLLAFAFAPALEYPMAGPGAGARVVAGDLDNDCDVDLVVVRDRLVVAENPSLNLLFNDGAGGFDRNRELDGGRGLLDVVAADLDHDGDLDLLTAESFERDPVPSPLCRAGEPRVAVLAGDGTGGFTLQACHAAQDHPSALAVADFHADHRPDLLVANAPAGGGGATSAEALLLRALWGGALQSGRRAFDQRADDLEAGDLDGDGRLDVVIAGRTGSYAALGAGDGTFSPPGGELTGPARRIALGDIDGDGDLDLAAVGSEPQSAADDVVWIALNDGSGSFPSVTSYPTGSHPVDVEIGDLDGDGDGDVVVANGRANTVFVYAAAPSGALGAPQPFAAGDDPTALVIEDLDGDGDLDLAVTDRNELPDGSVGDGSVSVLLQDAPAPLDVAPAPLPSGEAGVAYAACLRARGGAPPYAWSAHGGLPPGLALDGLTGRVAGVPSADGMFPFTAVVTDAAAAEASRPRDIAIAPRALVPGRVPPTLRVAGYDAATGAVVIQFAPACGATDHALHAGPLERVSRYDYDWTFCGLGAGGSATVPAGPGRNRFFLLAARAADFEGSAGRSAAGAERPGPPLVLGCPRPSRPAGDCP